MIGKFIALVKGADSGRVIFLDLAIDSAVLFLKGDLQPPKIHIALLPMGESCKIGMDIGWLGYPDSLCFFAGTVSARQTARKDLILEVGHWCSQALGHNVVAKLAPMAR